MSLLEAQAALEKNIIYLEEQIKNAEISELGHKLQEIDRERQRFDRLKYDREEKRLLSMNKLRTIKRDQKQKICRRRWENSITR